MQDTILAPQLLGTEVISERRVSGSTSELQLQVCLPISYRRWWLLGISIRP